MQTQSYPPQRDLSTPPAGPRFPNGQPLTERAGAATILAENAYAYEFPSAGGEDVYGCYKTATWANEYALDVCRLTNGLPVVTGCNCSDAKVRRRTCKHMIELAVVLSGGVRLRAGAIVLAASALPDVLSGPKTVADAVKAMCFDFEAAATKAVILTAAAVEEAEQQAAPRKQVETAPRKIVSGFDPSDFFSDWNGGAR